VEGGRLPRKCCVGGTSNSFFFLLLFVVKGGLSGHKHIYWNLIWQDLRGSILFILSTAIDIFDMDGSFDVPPPLIALWTSTSTSPSPLFVSLSSGCLLSWVDRVDHTQTNNYTRNFTYPLPRSVMTFEMLI
jgi:hypothetical protein